MLSRRELKIFLTFFLIYSLFVHWGDWYETSVFGLTKAIVDEHRFEIDTVANQTSDRADYNGHYYTDKAPGTSFIAVPIYAAWKFIYYSVFPQSFIQSNVPSGKYIVSWSNSKVQIFEYINPGFFNLTSNLLLVIFTTSLFSSLTVVLIYKISKLYTKSECLSLLAVIVAGFGSLIFPDGTIVYTHQIGMFFSVLTFYLVLKLKNSKKIDLKYIFFSGVFAGFAVVSDFPSVLVILPVTIYFLIVMKDKKMIRLLSIYFLGCLLGLLPFLVYNYSILHNFTELIAKYNDRQVFSQVSEQVFNQYGIVNLKLANVFQLLFGSYRGLFIYYPIFVISFYGIYFMYKENYKKDVFLILFVFIAVVLFAATRITWHGGFTFGPRFLLLEFPFLTIPLIFAVKNDKSIIFRFFFFVFLLLSIFINLLSLNIWEDSILDRQTLLISSQIQQKIDSYQNFFNPLIQHYLPLFFTYGPRSMIIENLAEGHLDVDIRDVPYSRNWTFPYHSNLNIGWVYPFILLIPVAIWFKEIRSLYKKVAQRIVLV